MIIGSEARGATRGWHALILSLNGGSLTMGGHREALLKAGGAGGARRSTLWVIEGVGSGAVPRRMLCHAGEQKERLVANARGEWAMVDGSRHEGGWRRAN
jgi:hypothetical protein